MKIMKKEPSAADFEWADNTIKTLFQIGLDEVLDINSNVSLYDWERKHDTELTEMRLFVASGASKVVFVPERAECRWVIKVSFKGVAEWRWKQSVDFAMREVDNYKAACAAGLEDFLAAAVYLGDYWGHPVILQERLEATDDAESCFYSFSENCVSHDYDEDEEDYLDRVECYSRELDDSDRIYAIFGENAASDAFVRFINERRINDLHEDNWGINEEGRIVAFDYSGY